MSVCLKRALCSLSVQSEREKRGEMIFKFSITGRASSLTHSHQFDKVICPTLPCTDSRASMHTMLVKNNHYYTTQPYLEKSQRYVLTVPMNQLIILFLFLFILSRTFLYFKVYRMSCKLSYYPPSCSYSPLRHIDGLRKLPLFRLGLWKSTLLLRRWLSLWAGTVVGC